MEFIYPRVPRGIEQNNTNLLLLEAIILVFYILMSAMP